MYLRKVMTPSLVTIIVVNCTGWEHVLSTINVGNLGNNYMHRIVYQFILRTENSDVDQRSYMYYIKKHIMWLI